MPIGKSAIKRVSKNGYANIVSRAPDMEDSVSLKTEEAVKPKASAKAKTAATKTVAKSLAKGEKPAEKKAEKTTNIKNTPRPVSNKPQNVKKTETPEARKAPLPTPIKGGPSAMLASAERYEIGTPLPIHLL